MAEALIQEGSGYAALDHSDEESSHTIISGVALGDGDVTRGHSGILKRWPAEALREAAETLQDTPIVVDHSNHRVEDVKGRVTKAGFKEGVGVIFEGELESGELTDKIGSGWLDVSPRILHEPIEEMEVEGQGDDPVHVVGEIKEFVNLSLVPRGAAPSNDVVLGEHEDLSAEEMQALVIQAISESLSDDPEPIDISVDVAGTADSVDVTVSSNGAEMASEQILSAVTGDSSSETEESEESASTDNSETEEMAQHQVHEPEWSGTAEARWQKPSLEDFTDESWDDLDSDGKNSIGDHFIVSKTGFPAENFGDLALPVVSSEGNLNLNALQNAAARASQVSGLSGNDLERAENIINRLANENFEDADFGDEEENEDFVEIEEIGLHTFRMSLFDRPVPEEEANSVENSLSQIDGVEAIAKSGDDSPQVVVVIDPDEISSGLNDEIRDALDDTPFLVRDDFDWVERVVREEGDRLSKNSALDGVSVLGDDDSQYETSTEDILEIPFLK